jgi:hypothetical protein
LLIRQYLFIHHFITYQMKTFIKLTALAFTATALFFMTTARAQTPTANSFRVSIGLETADPTGNARIGSDFSLGGTARLQYGLSNRFAITLTSGAYHFFTIINPATGQRYDSYGVIPIKAGIQAFFTRSLYFGAEAGIGRESTNSGFGPNRTLLSPAFGWASRHWDIAIHYDNFNSMGDNYGLVALRTAYAF